jgi:hypothetical protein
MHVDLALRAGRFDVEPAQAVDQLVVETREVGRFEVRANAAFP